MMRELLSELEAMRRAEAERAKSVASFERELAQAVEAMNAERASWENERAAKSDELALKDEHITRMVALVRLADQAQEKRSLFCDPLFFFLQMP